MNLVDKTKPSMKSLVEEIYSAGLYQDSDIADMVGFGMFDANDYQDITDKPYPVKSDSSNGVTSTSSTSSQASSSTSTSNSTSQPSTASSSGSNSSNASSASGGSDKK